MTIIQKFHAVVCVICPETTSNQLDNSEFKVLYLFTEYTLLSGSIIVLYPFFPEEDKYGTYAKLLIKYFLAEGIVSGHSLIVASQDYDCETLVCYV